jgi:hypothetical protein
MDVGRYRSVDVMSPRGGYRKSFVVNTPILDHRDGHYVRPNRVDLKYLNFKKDVDLDAHVRVFNFIISTNEKAYESMR